MAALNLRELIGKLNETCRKTLEDAAGLCLSRTHYNVEIEHWLFGTAGGPEHTDLAALLAHFGVDVSRVSAEPDTPDRPTENGQFPSPGVQSEYRGPDSRGVAAWHRELRGNRSAIGAPASRSFE